MESDQHVKIRPSMTTNWPDCQRRNAATLVGADIAALGFTLRQIPRHIGARVGTATHAGAATILKQKMQAGGRQPSERDIDIGFQAAMGEFEEALRDGEETAWDKTTDDRNIASAQIRRMVRSYGREIAPKVSPVSVEERHQAALNDVVYLTGQMDSTTREPAAIRDLKTGRRKRANGAQYGSYALIEEANGRPVTALYEDFVPRAPLRNWRGGSLDQPPAMTVEIPVQPAVNLALSIAASIQVTVTAFRTMVSKFHPNPEMAFLANPASSLCRDTFCAAWGTAFCRHHDGAR